VTDPTPLLDRPAAAAYLAALGLTHVTVPYLRKLASRGKGPRYAKIGKYVYYRREDLDWWVQSELRPVQAA
jgi:hypothetical protein